MKLGRYELVERLGEGESAVVHLARDLAQGGRPVALKVLKRQDPRDEARFRREFEVLAGLRHPNLVGVMDFGASDQGALYHSAEYHPGQRTLRQALFGPPPAAEALPGLVDALASILRGLEFVHTRGLVHRDLKPDNVLVDAAGEVRLSDFGLAGALDGQAAGTPHYMAPEVIRRLRVDRRCDLYSLGVLCYELLTGAVPYDGPDAATIARKHLEDRPRPPRELNPAIPEDLERVVLRLLEKEPSDRFSSANAVIAALSQVAGRELPFETHETKEAYVLSGRFVGRERELDWLVEGFQRATGPLAWDRDPREFDRRARFATSRGGVTSAPEGKRAERRQGGNRRASGAEAGQNPPALLVFLRGESGLGKTRLGDELRRRCQLEGAVVLQGACKKQLSRGYEPFIQVVQEAVQLGPGEELEEYGWAVQQLLAQPAEAPRGVERLRLVDALAELLLARACRRPLVIALEDLQWARGETLELLLHLHRSLVTLLTGAHHDERRPRLFLVATYRPEELHGPELGRALAELRRDRFFEELTLRPLRPDDVGELVRSMLGVPSVPRAFVERVAQESQGNPLLIELLMEELVARGVVDRARGLWRLDAERAAALEVPSRVGDLALARLARLPARPLLDWLALLDRPARPALLARLVERTEVEVARDLEELVARRVVERTEQGYELAHAKVRDVVHEALARGEAGHAPHDRPEMHRRIARALEPGEGPGEGGDLAELAHHLLEAGEGLEAMRRARQAGEALAAVGARERACELFARALRVADDHLALARHDAARRRPLLEEKLALHRAITAELVGLERLTEARGQTLEGLALARELGDAQAEVGALATLGRLNARLKELDDARRYFFEALKTAERIEYGKGIGRSLLGLGELTVEEGRLEDALEYLERSLRFERDLGDACELGNTLRALANAHARRGAYDDAVATCERALEHERAAGRRAGVIATLERLTDVHFLRGDLAAAVDAAEQTIALAEVEDDKPAVARAHLALGSCHERTGARAEARRRFAEAAATARRLGLSPELAQALNGAGWLHLLAGEHDAALVAFNEATTLWNVGGDRAGYAAGLVNLGLTYARRGDLERAAACHDAAARVAWELGARRAELEAACGRAAVDEERGQAARARELLDKTALRAREQRQPRLEALALADLARLLAGEGEGARALRAAQRARALAREVDEPRVTARVALRAAEADVLRGALAPALEALRGRGARRRPADVRGVAVEAELDLGRARAALGDDEGARAALDAALAEARARGARPLGARGLLAQGELLLGLGLARGQHRPGRVVVGSPELGEARARLAAAAAEAEAVGARGLQHEAALLRARVALLEGELDEARAGAQAALEAAHELGDGLRRRALLLLAEVEATGGDAEVALVKLDELDPLPPRQKVAQALVRAHACERVGRPLEARASLSDGAAALQEVEAALDDADRRRLAATAAPAALRAALERLRRDEQTPDAAPAGADGGVLAQARALRERALGFLRAARAVHAAGTDAPAGPARQDAQLAALIDRALALFGAQRGLAVEVLPSGEQVVRAARRAPGDDLPEAERRTSSAVVTRAGQTGEVLVVPDAQGALELSERPSVIDLELKSVLAIPVRLRGHARTVIVLEDRERRGRFQEEDRELAEGLGELAGHALERARLEGEAERAARELVARKDEIARLEQALQAELDERKEELDAVKAALEEREHELGVQSSYANIVGRSEPMQRIFRLLEKVTRSDVPVLIQGESGTGKELVARAVHFNGPRRGRPFMSINCAALPESLLEAELFGHVKGAFTGADRDKVGLLEAADGGTLFLDEVGDMPSAMQTKLLRALQEGEVRPLGSRQPRRVDVRVVSASNKDLRKLVDEGTFRADLFYRLNVVSVALPALRERKEDVPLLVDHLLDKIAARSDGKRKSLDRKVIDALLHHDWPGNVRELENELRRLVALSGQRITERDLSPHLRQRAQDKVEILVSPDDARPLKDRLEAIERRILIEALRRHDNNKTQTARTLGLSRYGFLKKLDKYSLREDELA
ncbi:MAG: sigma 54-interacting transcriptional regulator [Planctomycetes bacterium]|nr:sigma 54-interacting transcriptional regulator [Planctomycetota bacterium]